jgi:release factor glutamine methyltransferase
MPNMVDTPTIREMLADAAQRLVAAGVDQPRLDARLLLGHALGDPQAHFHGREEEVPTEHARGNFEDLVGRRLRREPVSRILGTRGFWTLDLEINAASLDPRPDSETLVEAVLEHSPRREAPLRVLDLGTGTGCLLLSVLAEFPQATGLGIDISPDCTALAARNARANGLGDRARFQTGDWIKGLHAIFDVIMCNPPYIPTSTIQHLAPEVAHHEPPRALDGGVDGLDCYRRLALTFSETLAENSHIFLEIGFDQCQVVMEIMAAAGLRTLSVKSDLAGHDRCLVIKRDD